MIKHIFLSTKSLPILNFTRTTAGIRKNLVRAFTLIHHLNNITAKKKGTFVNNSQFQSFFDI